MPKKFSNYPNIKNIIFDLGGVIMDVDYQKTIDEFKKLGIKNVESKYTQARQVPDFDQLDTGKISPGEFRNRIRAHSNNELTDKQIDRAWNAMLLDFRRERFILLKELRKHYKTFLLSNTNAIHLDCFMEKLRQTMGIDDLSDYFIEDYYSHRIGLRKPDREVYEYILNRHGLLPEETLFIDDSPQHVEGARKTGLQAHHLEPPQDINGFFNNY